ncbi:hypothetical protein GOP47_0014658 [Adiantum capillus-veneris]|uniref:Secreted protein n=1 Tax=Adiantum capillus-veneris TaxID=13818 RepID=A0A9D4ZEE5_ADICA|nr:hypothetical protein GOP47_0014658 [Adiantum capillus-veneris]
MSRCPSLLQMAVLWMMRYGGLSVNCNSWRAAHLLLRESKPLLYDGACLSPSYHILAGPAKPAFKKHAHTSCSHGNKELPDYDTQESCRLQNFCLHHLKKSSSCFIMKTA